MSGLVDAAIERYVEEHTTPPEPALAAVAERTRRELSGAGMLTGTVEGRLLETLVFASGASRVLELGTFSGYSALSMASALGPGGRIVTCEVSPERAQVARGHFEASPYGERIELRSGPALRTLAELEGPFDLVFIDADKVNYLAYYEAVLPLLARRGLIVADNTLWSGRVLGADGSGEDGGEAPSPETRALAEFNDRVRADDRVVSVMLTVRDGITLIRRTEA